MLRAPIGDRPTARPMPLLPPLTKIMLALFFVTMLSPVTLTAAAPPEPAAPPQAAIIPGTVELETGRGSGISVAIAEDLANLIDGGATRRVLPVVGKGGISNITDLLRGVDLAILQDDVMNYARQQNLFPGIEDRVTYIAKLYDEEFHLLARSDIKTVADLANQKVNVDLRGGGTEITTTRLFSLLNIPIVMTNDDPGVALEKLRRGEIAALAQVSGTPAPMFRELIGENNLHFLSLPLNPAVTAAYVPARLTADDYPALIQFSHPVDTVAASAVLVTADLQPASEPYRNVVNFVDAFFTGFQSLLAPGHNPKWHEVKIAAELPGWRRFQPAADWLQRNAPSGAEPGEQALNSIFARFFDERQQAAGGVPLREQQNDDLFTQFERSRERPQPSNLACDLEACADFYHSFRASDCTYQPSRGGSRQVCTKRAPQSAQSRVNPKTIAGSEEGHEQCNFAACSQTYSSFNPSDCTYQPYGGRRRELCKIAQGWLALYHRSQAPGHRR